MLAESEVTYGGQEAPPLAILYRNYRGETSVRRIIPERFWFGSTDWHPTPQWLLDAYDLDRRSERCFAVRDILELAPDTRGHVSDRSGTPGTTR